jgi:hypothetical protein
MLLLERIIFYLLILFLPTQLGKHFWTDFSYVSGIRIDYLAPTVYVTDILLVTLFILSLVRWGKNLKNKPYNVQRQVKSKNSIILILAFLFLCATVFISSRSLLSLYGLIKVTEFTFLIFYLAKAIRTTMQLQKIAILFAVSSLFESLLAIVQYIHQGSLNGIFYFFGERAFTGATPGIANADIGGVLVLRPYGTFSHPNVLAGYLLISLVLIWSFVFISKRQWTRILGIISLIVGSIALLLTFGRVAILLWGILVVCLLGKVLFTRIDSVKVRTLIIAVIIIGLAMIALLPITHDVILRFSQTSLSDESVTEREELLSTALTMIRQHPFFGVGLYNFIPAMAPLQKPMPLGLYLQPVHNIFVLVAAQTGIVGTGFFIWLLAATVARIKKQAVRIKGTFFVLLLIILVTGMFDHYWLTLQQGQLLFALVLGLCWTKIQKR